MSNMAQRERDDLPYRSPVTVTAPPQQVTSDEQDYSTLRLVREEIANCLEGLYKDFNAFDVLKKQPVADAAVDLVRQVEVNQAVYGVLSPLLQAIDSKLQLIDGKYREK